MLSSQICKVASNFTRDIKLVPKADTVLSKLVSASIPAIDMPIDNTVTNEQDIDNYSFFIETSTSGSLENTSVHDNVYGGTVDDLAKIVSSHISHAKNIVKPIVVEFAERLNDYVNFTDRDKALTGVLEVIQFRLPDLFRDESFMDNFKYYENATLVEPTSYFTFEDKSIEQLNDMFKIGHDRTDILIKDWFSKEGQDHALNIWNSFFSKDRMKTYKLYSDLAGKNQYERMHAGFSFYMIGKYLLENIQSSNMNIDQYNNFAASIRDYGGVMLLNSIKAIYNLIKVGILVVSLDETYKKIYVVEEVYKSWLDSTGSPEILFGLLVSNDKEYSTTAINSKKDKYLQLWESYRVVNTAKVENEFVRGYRSFIKLSMTDTLVDSNLTELEKDYRKTYGNVNVNEKIMKLVEEEIQEFTNDELNDTYYVALKIIGKCRFYFSSAFGILSDINSISKVNPNIDVREAALVATINYITDYLADQITVIK